MALATYRVAIKERRYRKRAEKANERLIALQHETTAVRGEGIARGKPVEAPEWAMYGNRAETLRRRAQEQMEAERVQRIMTRGMQ